MSNVANVLGKFDVSIAELVKKYQAEGKKMIGVSPIHMPVEMVYASGMIPMGLWGAAVKYPQQRNISQLSIVQ